MKSEKKANKNGINELKEVVATIRLPEIVLGFILKEFKDRLHYPIPSSEIYRRVGAKLSIDRKITRVCILILKEADLTNFVMVGKDPHIKVKVIG